MTKRSVLFAALVSLCLACGAEAAQKSTANAVEAFEEIPFAPDANGVTIVDGDTIWIGIHQIRFFGIDTVESDQTCLKNNVSTDCHTATLNILNAYTNDPTFRCRGHRDKDGKPKLHYGRYVATCYVGDVEVNRELVQRGWALAANTVSGENYRAAERDARHANVGLHSMSYTLPWEYRREKRSADCACEEP